MLLQLRGQTPRGLMVDIHSHILPGVDDGARTMEESVEMLKLAAASGTTDLVATPHANPRFPFNGQRIARVFEELSLRAEGLINLHLGLRFQSKPLRAGGCAK
jgi:protein-tyrosine phosphatase